MPTTLGKPYNTLWRGHPAHMLQQDIPVWYSFLDSWGSQFTTLYYDCLLGGPHLTDEELKDPIKRMWRTNTAKRADAIAELENSVWIIEVATDPGLRALGQLQTYRALWIEDPAILKPEIMVLVCERLDTDLGAAAAMNGIQIYVVNP